MYGPTHGKERNQQHSSSVHPAGYLRLEPAACTESSRVYAEGDDYRLSESYRGGERFGSKVRDYRHVLVIDYPERLSRRRQVGSSVAEPPSADAPERPVKTTIKFSLPEPSDAQAPAPSVATSPKVFPAAPHDNPGPEQSLETPMRALARRPPEYQRLPLLTDPPQVTVREALLQPFRTNYLPRPAPDEPLFLPADARRHWYLGYLYRWEEIQNEVIDFWNMEECREAFYEIEVCQIDEPRPIDLESPEESSGPAKLEDYFRREVLEVVVKTYNTLLMTETMQQECGDELPEGMWIEKGAEDEQLAAKGVKPTFLLRTQSDSGEVETRLLGQVEYLGGRPGALTLAIREAASNDWGTLRSVLGKLGKADFSMYMTITH